MPSSPVPADSLLAVLWRGRWIMSICVVAALAGALIYVRTATPIYTSKAKLYLDYAGIRISNPYDPVGRPQADKYLYTQAEVVRSRPILAATLEVLVPQRLQTFSNVEVPSAYLQKNVDVDVGKKDETITVLFSSPHPAEAAAIANEIVNQYMVSRSEHGHKDSAQVLKILQDEMVRAAKERDGKRNELTDFQMHRMPLALGSDQGGGLMQRYLEFQNAYTQAQIRATQAEEFRQGIKALAGDPSALRQYMRIRDESGMSVGVDREKSPLENQAIELSLEKESLLKKFTPDHPKIAELATEVEQLETHMTDMDDRFVKSALAAAEQQYAEVKSYEERLARLYEEQREHVVMLNAEVTQYQSLKSQADQLTEYARTVEQQVREVANIVNEDVGQLRMSILEPALASEEPSKPQKSRVMAMALLFGLLLGGGIAVARDWLNQTLRSADEISALFGLPALGVIPMMSRRQAARARGQRVFLQPESHESEAFRTVRTAIFFSAPTDTVKTLLVTSPSSRDGKSTLVSNLGIAMAMAGQKTIILDADLRKPSQRAIFGIDQQDHCLESVLAGKTRLSEAIEATGIDGLSLLTCGEHFPNPAEVLNSRQFTALLRALAKAYDRVLVDAPPATVVTDAQILGALCDCTILVLNANKTTKKMARHAIDALQGVGSRILGVVVNKVSRSSDRYGYYYGNYNRHYGSRTNGDKNKTSRMKARRQEPNVAVS
jgi:capsular exopolysaccharide synthesis family protein